MEYTQEQLNTVAQSYQDEITRLVQVKANLNLTILNLRVQIQELKKEVIDMKKSKKPAELNGTLQEQLK